MSELNQLSQKARERLQLAREGLEPSARHRQRVQMGLAVALAELPRVSPLDDGALRAGGKSGFEAVVQVVKPWVGALLLAGAGAGVGYQIGFERGQRIAAPIEAPAVATPASVPNVETPIAPASQRREVSAPTEVPVPSASPSKAAPSAPDISRVSNADADEIFQLQRVQRALRDGHPALSIAILRDLDKTHPKGRLMEERAAARIIAQCSMGSAVTTDQQTFVKRYPNSMYLSRIAERCSTRTEPSTTPATETPTREQE